MAWSQLSHVQLLTTHFPKIHLNITVLFLSNSIQFIFTYRCPKQILYNILFICPTGCTCRTDNQLIGLITLLILRKSNIFTYAQQSKSPDHMADPRLVIYIYVYTQSLSNLSYTPHFFYLNINLGCARTHTHTRTSFHSCQFDTCGSNYLWTSFKQYITYIFFEQFTTVYLLQHLCICSMSNSCMLHHRHFDLTWTTYCKVL
jgi:hypothetical protein